MKNIFSKKSQIIGVSLLFISTHLFSQQWEAFFPEVGGQAILGNFSPMLLTDDGGIVMTGFDIPTSIFFVLKYDNAGELLWYNEIVQNIDVLAINTEAVQTDDGNIVVVGTTDKIGFNFDVIAAKYSNAGEELWVKIFNNPEAKETGVSVVETIQGDLLVTGTYSENDLVHIFLKKLDADGGQLWHHNIVTNIDHAAPSRIKKANDGNYIVSGHFDLSGYLLKINADGEILSEIKFRPPNSIKCDVHDFTENAAGEIFVSGFAYGDDLTLTRQFFFGKIANDESLEWAAVFGNEKADIINAMMMVDDGVIGVGYDCIPTSAGSNFCSRYGYMAKFDFNGEMVCEELNLFSISCVSDPLIR